MGPKKLTADGVRVLLESAQAGETAAEFFARFGYSSAEGFDVVADSDETHLDGTGWIQVWRPSAPASEESVFVRLMDARVEVGHDAFFEALREGWVAP